MFDLFALSKTRTDHYVLEIGNTYEEKDDKEVLSVVLGLDD